MSENLIYGADITAYGAVADGKTDCSDAFIKAVENGESLIVVPYGKYFIKKSIKLTSNTKLHFHPLAELYYEPSEDETKPLFYAEDDSSIVIQGGKFHAFGHGYDCGFIGFKKVSNLTLTEIKTYFSAVSLFDCETANISKCTFFCSGGAIHLSGKCRDVYVKNIRVQQSYPVIKAENCSVSSLSVRNISILICSKLFEFSNGSASNVICEDVKGAFNEAFVSVNDGFSLEDSSFENIEVYSASHFTGNLENAYFNFSGSVDGVDITCFKRNADNEASPFIPTLVFKAHDDSKAIIDGMSLDHVINARALSKTINMTTARLTNPTNKFIYTLECGIKKDDTLTIPLGDFDSLTIYKK